MLTLNDFISLCQAQAAKGVGDYVLVFQDLDHGYPMPPFDVQDVRFAAVPERPSTIQIMIGAKPSPISLMEDRKR